MKRRSYSLMYFLGQSFKGLGRHFFSTVLLSVTVFIFCLVLTGFGFLLSRNISANLDDLSMMNEIVIFLDYDATDDDVERIRGEIEGLENLGELKVEYISKEQALQNMIDENPDNAYLYEDIPAEDNPLADSFVITYDDMSKVNFIDYKLRQIEGVRKVNNRLDLAVRVNDFKQGVDIVASVFVVLLIAVSIFVIITTVNSSVYYRRDEIYVMRFVGASRLFIALPFLLEGAILGAFSAGAAYFITKLFYGYVANTAIAGLDMLRIMPFDGFARIILIGYLLIGTVSGILGSWISIRRPLDA